MGKYKMFVDESGNEHPSHHSKQYILIGVIIDAKDQDDLEKKADQIKYRYWKRTNVVFHSREIAKETGDFSIFRGNKKLKDEFINDILRLIRTAPVKVTCAVVDKAQAYRIGWKSETIIRKSASSILIDFLNFVYTYKTVRNTGTIIYESSGYNKDAQYLQTFNAVLTPGFEKKNPQFADIREHLTSVSFATKLNKDIECEIADLLSYAALQKHECASGSKKLTRRSYEYRVMRALESKLLKPGKKAKRYVGFDVQPISKPKKKKPAKKKRTA